jgi:dTDP-4-dehydrorhamnose reductase
MRLLVAGASGQLAHALVERSRRSAGVTVTAMGRPQLDLLDQASIAAPSKRCGRTWSSTRQPTPRSTRPRATPRPPSRSTATQRERWRQRAAAAGCPIIHVSTDYVFDGAKSGAYLEEDATNPMGVYGRSKLDGEAAVAAGNAQHVILRTAWLYGAHGSNFLKTMLRLARERPELRVVADQHGNPTYAPHLADAILAIAAQVGSADHWGTYHAAATGETTWHGFASAIIAAAKPLGVPQIPVLPISTAEYPTPVRRPANSCLDCRKLERTFGVRLPTWQQGLAECIAELA